MTPHDQIVKGLRDAANAPHSVYLDLDDPQAWPARSLAFLLSPLPIVVVTDPFSPAGRPAPIGKSGTASWRRQL